MNNTLHLNPADSNDSRDKENTTGRHAAGAAASLAAGAAAGAGMAWTAGHLADDMEEDAVATTQDVETTEEPVAEPVTEPSTETVAEPVAETAPEPVETPEQSVQQAETVTPDTPDTPHTPDTPVQPVDPDENIPEIAETEIDPEDYDGEAYIEFSEVGKIYNVDGSESIVASAVNAEGTPMVMVDIDGDEIFDVICDNQGNVVSFDTGGMTVGDAEIQIDDTQQAYIPPTSEEDPELPEGENFMDDIIDA